MQTNPTSKLTSASKKTPKPKASSEEELVSCKITIGPPKFTRFERARIIGARSLQLALGAPPFIPITGEIKDTIVLAIAELELKVLPISIRRSLPDGRYQDIPIDWLL